jgi:hypothetical protein
VVAPGIWRTIIRGRIREHQQSLRVRLLAPIAQEKPKRRRKKYANFQAESVALPPDAADRPDQAIISTRPIWPARH